MVVNLSLPKFLESLEEVPEAVVPTSDVHSNFYRVLAARNISEIEDISLDEIDEMLVNMEKHMRTVNFLETYVEKLGRTLSAVPRERMKRRVL